MEKSRNKLREFVKILPFVPAGLALYFVAEALEPDFIDRGNLHYYERLAKLHLSNLRKNGNYRILLKDMYRTCASRFYLGWRRDFANEEPNISFAISQALFSKNIYKHIQSDDIDIVRLEVKLAYSAKRNMYLNMHYQLESLNSNTVARTQENIKLLNDEQIAYESKCENSALNLSTHKIGVKVE